MNNKQIKKIYYDEYTNRIESIESNIINAYIDYFYLIEIGKFMKRIHYTSLTNFVFNDSLNFIKGIMLSFQKEFSLIIWKIFLDTDGKANTIYNLRNALNKDYLFLKPLNIKNIDTATYKEEIKKLNYLRKTYLAHSDMNTESTKIDLKNIKSLLNNIVEFYNKLLFDDMVKSAIDDEKIKRLEQKSKNAVEMLFNGSFYKIVGGTNE